jgi:hypothetical protein
LGTIQDAAAHGEATIYSSTLLLIINSKERSLSRILPGSIARRAELITDDKMRLGLVNYYTSLGEQIHLSGNTDNSEPLGSHAQFFHYALLDGRRIRSIKHPESKHGSIGCSLIQIQYRGEIFSGEVQTIFRHKQEGLFDPQLRDRLLVHIQWMKPALEGNPLDPRADGENPFIWQNL